MEEGVKFSVLTSYYADTDIRKAQLQRTVRSVLNQTFEDFEYILCDDGSPETQTFPSDQRIVKVHGPHLERVVSLSRGLDQAKGEWIVFIDADDELFSYSLEAMSQMIDTYPQYKLFNYGSIHIHKDYVATVRGPHEPERKDVGHVVFGGGTIVWGTFIIKKEAIDKHGAFPTEGRMWSPWDFSIKAQELYPEIKPYFTVNDNPNHPPGTPKELGNPWGNDFFLWYKFTRHYHTKTFQFPLIIVHHEKGETWGHEIKKDEEAREA